MCEKELLEIAEKYGFELKKELKYRIGYCYEFHLVNGEKSVYAGYASAYEKCYPSREELENSIKELM